MSDTNQCVQTIDNAIDKVREARHSLQQKEYEEAENRMVDTVQLISEALYCINEQEQPSSCDRTGAIPIINIVGTEGTPPGTANLIQGNKYLTPLIVDEYGESGGAVITWTGNTITVCEVGTPPDIWSVTGSPLTIEDVTGKIQQVPTPYAMIFFEDGTSLLVGTNEIGVIAMARYLTVSAPIAPSSFQGYSTNQTEVYMNDENKSKVAMGTVYSIYGV